jgi:Family of unknown function (DUF6289)
MIRRIASTAMLMSALVVASTLVASPAQAIPVCKSGFECDRVYYTDATHDVPVGGFTRFCDGSTTSWGTTTRFQVTTQAECPSDPL